MNRAGQEGRGAPASLMSIPVLDAGSLGEGDATAALMEAGAVVLSGIASAEMQRAVEAEMAPLWARTKAMKEQGEQAFYAGDTKRVGNLLSKMDTVSAMVIDDRVLDGVGGALLPNCSSFQLHVCSGLNVGPGARAQVLHREDDWDEVREWSGEAHEEGDKKALCVATMWAMTPFTSANGATLIVRLAAP